ncbi:uncharacterized protein LOC120833032 isoform X1 [Gasterosteus aculeatus]
MRKTVRNTPTAALHYFTKWISGDSDRCFLRRRGTNNFSMGFKRTSFLLLILGTISTDTSGQSLDCTNDFSVVTCQFNAQNCAEYSLTLQIKILDIHEDRTGPFIQCEDGRCCCSLEGGFMVFGDTHTATVWKGNKSLESKDFNVKLSIKPKAPTIRSVKESNGNFEVTWNTNMESFINITMKANLTYHKKGDREKVSEFIKPSTKDGQNYFEILGRHLEPSTTYVVSVKSYTNFSGKFSESSKEMEFTTAMSPVVLPLTVIICLCLAAVLITGAIYVSYVKVKTHAWVEWWVAVSKCPNPKLAVIYPSTQKVLKPGTTNYSIVCVEPFVPDDNKSWLKKSPGNGSSGSLDQSSGISTGSSCISYPDTLPERDIITGVSDALKKALSNIVPFSTIEETNKDSGLSSAPYQPCQADDMSSGAVSFTNETYSIVIPSVPHQILTNSSQVQTQSEIPCDFAHHRRNIGTCVDPPAPSCLPINLPPGVPCPMPTDMSYQQCNADSGGGSYAEARSPSSASSGTNSMALCDAVSSLESRWERYKEAVCGVTKQHGQTEGLPPCEETPGPTAGSNSFPPVEDDYQPFQNLAAQPLMIFDESADKKVGHLNRYPEELFTAMPQCLSSPGVACLINDAQDGAPISLMPADPSSPLMSDPGYQRV